MLVMDLFCYAFTAVLFGLNHVFATIKRIDCSPVQKCIPLNSCPEVLALFNKEGGVERAQGLICGFESFRSKVCCNASRETSPKTPANATPTIGLTPVTPSMTVTPVDVSVTLSTIVTPLHVTVPPSRTVTPVEVSVIPSMIVAPVTSGVTLLPEQCGSIGERVVGGKKLPLRSYMWLALLGRGTRTSPNWSCGGSLISQHYVVSAAHCVINPTITHVRLGEHDISKEEDCENFRTGPVCADPVQDFIIGPGDIIPHPAYNKRVSRSNDIALIRLNQPAQLNRYVKPICLPSPDLDIKQFLKGRKAEVAGWGRIDGHNFTETSDVNLMVELPFVDLETCRGVIRNRTRRTLLDKGQVCFGGELGKDSCGGDSGGPLVSTDIDPDTTNLYVLLGVVSYGLRFCGTIEGFPGVYTEVSHYRNWIVSNLRP